MADKHKYEENLQEEQLQKAERSTTKSLDLMKKLNDYLSK
jgi:hypothetical protein